MLVEKNPYQGISATKQPRTTTTTPSKSIAHIYQYRSVKRSQLSNKFIIAWDNFFFPLSRGIVSETEKEFCESVLRCIRTIYELILGNHIEKPNIRQENSGNDGYYGFELNIVLNYIRRVQTCTRYRKKGLPLDYGKKWSEQQSNGAASSNVQQTIRQRPFLIAIESPSLLSTRYTHTIFRQKRRS